MFIQVIQAPCTRPDEIRRLTQEWSEEVGDQSEGWLGGTYGCTDDGTFIAVVRFESKDAAMANSARPQTTAMSERMAALMDGPPEFHDCDDVTEWLDGGSDDAGFVQIIRGKTADPAKLKEVLSADTGKLRELRPEIIGGTLAIEADGTFTQTVAFTDEESARQGEQKEPPPEMADDIAEAFSDVTYFDLRDPWFASA